MKNLRFTSTLLLFLIGLFSFQNQLHAQDFESVKKAIQAHTDKEQKAFIEGDCETVLDLMTDDIGFYANGRKAPSKKMIGMFCEKIPRPFGTLNNDHMEIIPLTNESGYTLRTMDYYKNDRTKVEETVTKVWIKTTDGWKIKHLHSTVKEIPRTKD